MSHAFTIAGIKKFRAYWSILDKMVEPAQVELYLMGCCPSRRKGLR